MRAAKSWLSSLERPWLLIIDNVDNPNASLEEYIPAGERGFNLITTRNPSNKVYSTLGTRFYAFEKLEEVEATNLFLKAAEQPSPWTLDVRKSAISIATALGFLPLALLHTDKAIMKNLCSLDNYLEYCHRSWHRIRRDSRRTRSRSSSTASEYGKENMGIYSTHEIIYTGPEHRDGQAPRDAAELLNMFLLLYREYIEYDMLVAAVTNPRLEQEQQKNGELTAPAKHPT